MFRIEHDGPGLERAARELMEAALVSHAREKLVQRSPGLGEGLREPEATLADLYYERATFLLWLERRVGRAQLRLTAAQSLGLDALERAREKFDRDHPPCASCGAHTLEDGWELCWSCWKRTDGKEAA